MPSRQGEGHAQPSVCNRRVSREEYLINRRASCGPLEASLQPSSTKTSVRCLFFSTNLYCSRTTIDKSATTGLALALTGLARTPASRSAQDKNLRSSCHGDSTCTSLQSREEHHGELLHGRGSSPPGFIKGGDAAAERGGCVREITSLFAAYPFSPYISLSLFFLLITAHHG